MTPSAATSPRYDAFISYSHEADHRLAREIERALERLGKPWYKRRAMDVFRDEGNLNLSAHLWGSIEQAIDASRFFLYMASPQAARSHWVPQEINHWKTRNGCERLIIVLTDGGLEWNSVRGDFEPAGSPSIPDVLHGAFKGEPLYLDMRWVRAEPDGSLRHDPRFIQQVVQIAAALRGLAVEDIAGEDAEQHRRTIRIRNAAIAGLAVLALAALAAAGVAFVQRGAALAAADEARRQQQNAERFAGEARASADEAERRRAQADLSEGKATTSAGLALEVYADAV
jgi:hypothetical protein